MENPRIRKIAEVFNYEEKKKFIEILLIVATLLTAFRVDVYMIPTFTIFIISSLMFIIWISMLQKLDPLTKEEKHSYISKRNIVFSALVSFSFSSLVFIFFIQSSVYSGIMKIIFSILSLLALYGLLGYILLMALCKEKKTSIDEPIDVVD